jgi:hypothetical protein
MFTTYRRIAGTFVAMLAVALAAAAQGIVMSLPALEAKRGDTILIPVNITALAATDSVRSCQFTLDYDRGVLNVFAMQTNGTLSSGASTLFNPVLGTFALASTSSLTGSGTFVAFKAVVLQNPTRLSAPLRLLNAVLNEGTPAITVTDGSIRIFTLSITPKSPSNVIVGTPLQFGTTGDVFPPLTWRSSDTSVGTLNSSGLFLGKNTGQLIVYVRDSIGLQDSTNLFAVNPPSLSQLTVSFHDTSMTQTLEFDVPVYVSDVTGLGILSAQMKITWYDYHLQALSVSTTGTLSEQWSTPAVNISAGSMELALAGSTPLSGAGKLVMIRFRVRPTANGSSDMNIASVTFNETINATAVKGSFTSIPAPVIAITPIGQELVIGDPLAFSATGGTPPYSWSSSDSSILSVNALTGSGIALKRGTAAISAQDSRGFIGTTTLFSVNNVGVSIRDTVVHNAMSQIDIPILVGDLSGFGVISYQMNIGYSSRVLRFVGVQTAGTLSSGFSLASRDTLNVIRVAAASTTPLTTGGTLFFLRFTVVPETPIDTTITLSISSIVFNEAGINAPTGKPFPGKLTMAASPLLEMGVTSIDYGKVAQGDSLARTVSLKNKSGYPITVTGLNFGTTTFTTNKQLPFIIPGKDSIVVSVWFKAGLDTLSRDTLVVVSNAGTLRIALRGESKTLPAPIVLPAMSVTQTSFTATWNPVVGATGYRLDVGDSLFMVYVAGYQNLLVSDSTTKLVSGLTQVTKYFYRVRAFNAVATSGNSNVVAVVTLAVPTFTFSAKSVSLIAPQTTTVSDTLLWTRLNGFKDSVTFNCTGLPTGTKAIFTPQKLFDTLSTAPVLVMMDISVDTNAVPGIYQLTVQAVSPNLTRTINIQLTVVARPEWSIAASPDSLEIFQGNSGKIAATITSLNQFTGVISLSTSTLPTGITAVFKIGSVNLSASGTARDSVTFSVASNVSVGVYTVTLIGTPQQPGTIVKSVNVKINVKPISGVENTGDALPKEFSLAQNYPNPFNPSTVIRFSIPSNTHVMMKIYNMQGQEVGLLVNESLPVGTYTAHWNASNLPSGVYYCRLTAGTFIDTKKMLLVR